MAGASAGMAGRTVIGDNALKGLPAPRFRSA